MSPTTAAQAQPDTPSGLVPDAATFARVAEALARADALSPWLGASTQPAPADAPDLAALAADHEALADLVARCAARLETDRLDVAAGLLFHDIAWRVLAPAITAAVVSDIAPRLTADTVTVVLDARGASTAVHLTSCLAGAGEAGGAPDLTLLRGVRDDAVGTLRPLVTALRPLARRGLASMWGEVADTIASALQLVGDLTGRAQACRAAADALLDGSRPIRGGANWVEVDHAGVSCTWRVRNSCCKAYELAAYDYCAGCPMLCDADQRSRFEALNEARAGAASA